MIHEKKLVKNRKSEEKKNQIFEKQSKLMHKLLKAWYFMNKMHEYEIKGFSKNT